jgi:hypothetical protein
MVGIRRGLWDARQDRMVWMERVRGRKAGETGSLLTFPFALLIVPSLFCDRAKPCSSRLVQVLLGRESLLSPFLELRMAT